MRNWTFFFLAMFILFPLVVAPAQQLNSTDEQRIQKLEQIIQEQSERIQDLQKKVGNVEQPSKEYTEQIVREYMNRPHAEEAAAISAGYESKGFFIRSADGNLELYMSGLIQMGLGIFENHSSDHNSFYPNGVSLAFDMYFMKDWHGRIQFNLWTMQDNAFQSGGYDNISLWDAYIEYIGIPELNVRVGQFHVPFTIEGQYGPTEGISIWSEPFIRNWSHGRDEGIMFLGTIDDMFEYKLGLFNGEGTRLNQTDEFLMAAGLRVYPWKKSENPYSFFHVGVMRSRDDTLNGTGNINAASLFTPWGRQVFDGVFGSDSTQGWKTGVDVGGRIDMFIDDQKVNRLRVEGEYMYMTWERNFAAGRQPYLDGVGFSFGIMLQHNLTPEVEGAGIFPMFKLSYCTTDNEKVKDPATGNVISGQTMWTYTFGLGYAFNKFVCANFNWVMVDLQQTDIYGGPKTHATDPSDDVEHAWFMQVTAQW